MKDDCGVAFKFLVPIDEPPRGPELFDIYRDAITDDVHVFTENGWVNIGNVPDEVFNPRWWSILNG